MDSRLRGNDVLAAAARALGKHMHLSTNAPQPVIPAKAGT
jgi:hypothetical protein